MKNTLLAILLAIAIAPVYAEDKKDNKTEMTPKPEKMEQVMQNQMQAMAPMFGQITKIMMRTQFEVLAEPETTKRLATYTKNYYQALIDAGFTKEEALKIVINIGIPTAPMTGK